VPRPSTAVFFVLALGHNNRPGQIKQQIKVLSTHQHAGFIGLKSIEDVVTVLRAEDDWQIKYKTEKV
jgi:hypothetical protein